MEHLLLGGRNASVLKQGMWCLTVSHLALIHGVITDVHNRPWVCLGGSVRQDADGKKKSQFKNIRVVCMNLKDGMYDKVAIRKIQYKQNSGASVRQGKRRDI